MSLRLAPLPRLLRALLAGSLLAAVAVLVLSAPASAAVTQKEAAKRALTALRATKGNDAKIVFGLPKPIKAGTKVTQAGTSKPSKGSKKGLPSKLRSAGVRTMKAPGVMNARTRSYFFYEDRGPFQLYQHPGRVALVDVRTGRVRVSRMISWPPLLNGRLPAFLKSAGAYRSSKYQVLNRPWEIDGNSQQPKIAYRNQFDNDPFGPGRPLPDLANARAIADRLAAERSCVLRVTDTLPSFWNVNDLNLTRSYVGTLFEALERQNNGFIDDRYGARSGESLAQSVDRLTDAGCKDVLLYIAGQGYSSAKEPTVHLGTSVRRGGLIAQQNITASDLQKLVSGRPGITFKFKFDAPYSGGFIDSLKTLPNVLLIETPAAAGQEAFSFVPAVEQNGQMVKDQANMAGLLEFTNCELVGLKSFFDSQAEIDKASQGQNEGVSFLAEMLARSQELCRGVGFADDLGASPQLYAAKRASGNPSNRPPKADPQSVTVNEDQPKAITLTGSDPDGDPLTFTITKQPDHGTLSGSGANRTYTPDPNYTGSDDFSFKVEDDKGAGSNTAKVSLNVTEGNDEPIVTNSPGATPYTEGDPGTVIDASLTVSDPDDTQLESATVAIHGDDFQAPDKLEFTNQLGITGFYSTSTGILTLTGTASVSDYQTALRDVRFRTDSDAPRSPKRILFSANDGELTSAASTKSITITGVNDAPQVNATDTPLDYTENDGAVPLDSLFSVTDVDSNNLSGATIDAGSAWVPAEDELAFPDNDPSDGITLGSYNDTTGVLTLTGTGSVNEYAAAIRAVTYENNSENPDTTQRTFDYTVTDEGALASNTDTRAVDITRVNDAPVVTTSAGSTPYTENEPATAVDGSLTVSDVDDTQLESAEVKISTGFESGDELVFVDGSGITGSYNSGTGVLTLSGTASVSDYQAALRSIGFRNTSSDNMTSPKTVDFKVNDGALDSSVAQKNIAVTPVNDNPILDTTDADLAYTEGDGAVAVDSGITVADPDSTTLAGATVQITSNFSSAEDDLVFTNTTEISGSYNDSTGTLTLTGTATLAQYQAALRSVQYQNTSDNPSTATRTVSFQADDGGAVDNLSPVVTRDITVAPVNDAPVVNTSAGNTSYTEGDPGTVIDGALTVSDADDTNIESAEVKISSGFESGDDLTFVNTATITGTYNTGTGVLTLTGTDTVANYQAALRSITFDNTVDDDLESSKVIDFKVNDGSLDSSVAQKTIAVTPVNDNPVLDTTDADLAYTEGDGAVAVDNGITVTDPDSAGLVGATVQITSNFNSAEDDLVFTDTTEISGSYNDATGTLTLSGPATLAQYQAALRSVQYQNTSDNPSTATRTVSFQADDGGAVDNLSNVATRDITVAPTNDAPVVDTSAGPTSYSEGDPATTIDGSLTVSDADDTNLESAEVRISSNFEAGDDLVFVDQNGITGTYNSGTGVLTLTGSAPVADYQTALRSIQYRHTGDNPAGGKTVAFKVNDGDVDSATDTKTINITGVNDGPVLTTTAAALSYTEGDGAVAVDPGLTLDDPENNSITGATVQITSNFSSAEDDLVFTDTTEITGSYNDTTGTLTLSGTATEAQYQAALRSVAYQNSSDNPSTATRTVTFQTTGDSGSPSQASNTATRDISVANANDAPVVNTSAGSTSYSEGGSPATIDNALTVTDADDTSLEGGQVRISSGFQSGDDLVFVNQNGISGVYNSGTGVLTLTGSATEADYQTALRSIQFQTTNDNPVASKTIEFKVNDGDTDSNLATKEVTVTGANDAPTLTTSAGSASFVEDGSGNVAVDPNLTLTDPDSTNIQGATVEITTGFNSSEDQLVFADTANITGVYNSGTGVLTLTGVDTVANYQAALRTVQYNNTDTVAPDTTTRTVRFQATDDGGAASNLATRDVTVSSVNDPPVVNTSAGSTPYTEDDPATTIDGALTVSDQDDTNLEGGQVRISSGFQSGDDLVFVNQNGISGVYNSGTGVLTLTGSAPVADYQTALRSIQFQSTQQQPVTSKTVEFKLNDGDVDSNLATKEIAVTPTNDAPIVNATDTALSYTENDPATAVDNGLTIDDTENDNLSGGSASITANYQAGQDFLAWTDNNLADNITLDNINSNQQTIVLTGVDTEANYQAALRSVTYQNGSEAPSNVARTVTFSATDQPGLTGSDTRTINVTPVDDPPDAVNDSETVLEDAAATSVPVLTNDTDIDGGPKTISSATDPANGTVVLTGGSPGAHAGLTYQPDPNYCNDPPGTTPDTFTYTVNGGDTATVSMTVTCVNDAPVADAETVGGTGGPADPLNNVNNQAHGNTTMQVDDPSDDKSAPTNPHTEITGDILNGDTDPDGPGPLIVQSAGSDAGATNGQTADGGTVSVESDGDFVYQPPASVSCDNGSDSFNYKISDQNTTGPGPTPGTAIGTVTIHLEGCVWYVSNNAAGNAGTATQPFDTLAQAETASGANHTVFVFDGDNTSTGYQTGFAMNSGERLIGEHEGLTHDQDQGGPLTADSLHPANPGAHPTLAATNEDVVDLDDGNELRGFNLDPAGTGGGIGGASGDTGGGTIDDVNIIDTAVAGAQPLLELDSTTGTFNISNFVANNQAASSPPSTATGVRLNNAGTVNFNPTGQTSIGINGAKGLDAISTNMGSGSTFDDITVAGSSVGGVELLNTTGTTAFGDGTGSDLSLTTTSGSSAAFRVNNGGTVSVAAAGADDLHATGGPALDVTGTSGAQLEFDDVDSTNSAGDGINIDGLGTGTFSASSGDIGGYAGIGFDLNSGSGAITYPGAFGNGSGTFVAEITGRSGGVVSLSGSISDTNDSGGGINLAGNTGGSTSFSNATKQLNTGTVDAVDFQSSDGHTLVLSGGGTDIDTTSGRGVDAETSGTLQINGSGNTVLTDTGRGINIANTDIAASDVTFDSVRVNSDLSGSGPDIGIRLENTGSTGNLAVTGTGNDCTSTASCTGGVIHNTTSDGVRLTNAHNTSLTDMYIGDSDGTGIHAPSGTSNNSFNDLHIHNNGDAVGAVGTPDAGIFFGPMTGTNTITGTNAGNGATTVQQSRNNQIEWDTNTGTGTLNITNTDVLNGGQGPSTGANGISVVGRGSATANLNVGNGGAGTGDVDITNNPADGLLTNATDTSTVTSDTDNVNFSTGNRAVNHSGQGTTIFRINNSDFSGFNPPADTGSAASTISINPTTNGQLDATITNNRVGTAGQNGSGAGRNFGIVLGIEDGSDADVNISNNTITETAQEAIFLYQRDFLNQGGSVSNTNLTLRDNVVTNLENLPAPDTFTNLNGIEVEAQHDAVMCADIANNDSDSIGSSTTTGTELRTRQLGTSTFRLEGLSAGSNSETVIETFLNTRNPLIPLIEIDAQVTTQYTAEPGNCPMPTLP